MSVSTSVFVFRVGLCMQMLVAQFDISSPWHIYWKNPGESGLLTELQGEGLGETLYPTPIRFESLGGVVNYGYGSGETVLFAPVSKRKCRLYQKPIFVSWLECTAETCVKKSSTEIPKKVSKQKKGLLKIQFEQLPAKLSSQFVVHNGRTVDIILPSTSLVELFPDEDLEAILDSWSQEDHIVTLYLKGSFQGEAVLVSEDRSFLLSHPF